MATIYDVARKAGVSPKTVSRVLNGDAPVNGRTRELVHKAMAELDYVPSNAARTMRSQKSGLIGLITGAIQPHRRASLSVCLISTSSRAFSAPLQSMG